MRWPASRRCAMLLSDPASRADLLTALDTPARRTFHFWEWLRRPAVAGLAVAGVGGIAVVAVVAGDAASACEDRRRRSSRS